MKQNMTTRNIWRAASVMMRHARITPPILCNTLNISVFCSDVSRLALVAVFMLLTSATAWAQVNVVVNITGDGTVTLTHDNQEETVTSGTSYSISDGNFTLTFTPASGNVLQSVSREIYMSSSGDITQELINNNGVYVYNGNVYIFPHTYNVIFAEEGAATPYSLSGQIYNASGATMTFSVGDQQNVTTAAEGAQVGITMSEPEENAYWDLSSQQVTITRDDATHFHFTMPANNVSIRAEQVVIQIEMPTLYSVTDNSTGGYVRVRGNKYLNGFEEGETVTLIPIPDAGYEYVANSLIATNNSTGAAIALTDNGDATRSFQMPAANVTVTGTFSTNNPGNESQEAITMTQEGSINMPTSGTTTVNIPEGVTKFYVYDDGGPSGNFSDGCNGQMLLIAPEGKLLKVNGTVIGGDYLDGLTIMYARLAVYNGSSTSATNLYQSAYGSFSNITSSDRQMLLHFYDVANLSSTTTAGFSLTVEVVEPTTAHSITIADGITHGTVTANKTSAVAGETVTLTVTTDVGYEFDYFTYVTTSIGNNQYTFNMPDEDVTISASFHVSSLFGYYFINNMTKYIPDGSADYPYIISTTDGWNLFCDCLAEENNTTWNRFSSKIVKLGKNIEVSRMAGSQGHDFCGTFDGGGKTLTFNYGSSGNPANDQYAAPFSHVSNVGSKTAAIKNLHVAGDIYTSAKYAAGIVGQHWGTLNIENCRSSVVIHSSVSGDGTHGGIEAASNGTLNITGCVFDGKLLTTNATTRCGGFVGFGTCTISNSLYTPSAIADGETEVGATESATFARGDANNISITNSYYTRLLGTAQGLAPLAVTAGDNVTVQVSPVGEPVANGTYSVSGITAYAKGITRTVGQTTTFYYGSEDQVSLTLSNTAAPLGYQYSVGSVSGGTLDGSTLTMPDADVTVSSVLRSTGQAVPVAYVDEKGKLHNDLDGTLTPDDNTDNAIFAIALDGTEEVDYGDGWISLSGDAYYVGTDITYNDRTIVFSDNNGTTLILGDGATMTVTSETVDDHAKYTIGANNLTIFGQALGTGKLNVSNTANGGNGIYAYNNITINGGSITATANSSGDGYGIYSGGGDITINGGNVSATGFIGICANQNITIKGGTVSTRGSHYSISASQVTIKGGNVSASGDSYGIYGKNIYLGWTNYTDRIYANSYRATGILAIAEGKEFIDEDGALHTATSVGTLDGKTLYPYPTFALTATKIDDNYWTTFYCGNTGYKIDDAENACAYTATVSDETITMQKLGKVIPQGTAVIIVGEDSEISMTADNDSEAEYAVDGNHLHGEDVATATATVLNKYTDANTLYFLSNKNGKFGFHKFAGSKVPARKAFLALTESQNARSLTIVFEDTTTGVPPLLSPEGEDEGASPRGGLVGVWYSLDGRKLDGKPTAKGVYINNKRKVVVK